MGKNQRLRKEIKLNEELTEKVEIQSRRQDRVGPVYRMARRLSVAVLVTIFLLYGGIQVNRHLDGFVAKIKNVGQSNQTK